MLAVPEESAVFQKAEDLEGKIIATELVEATKRYFAAEGGEGESGVQLGRHGSEAAVLADAIVEVTETGSSLRANRLRIMETVLECETQFIANQAAWEDAWKREKIDKICLMLQGAIAARARWA